MDTQTRIGIGGTALFTIAGIGAPLFGWAISGPIMIACAAVAAWGFWPVIRGRAKARPPEPNTRLEDVVKRIRSKEDIFGPENAESMKVLEALESIREKALHGSLTVFGCESREWRATKPEHWGLLVRHQIPAEHWKDHKIDYMEFATDRHGEVIDVPNARGATYRMLWFDKDQVSQLWPQRRRKIDWRNPINWRS